MEHLLLQYVNNMSIKMLLMYAAEKRWVDRYVFIQWMSLSGQKQGQETHIPRAIAKEHHPKRSGLRVPQNHRQALPFRHKGNEFPINNRLVVHAYLSLMYLSFDNNYTCRA